MAQTNYDYTARELFNMSRKEVFDLPVKEFDILYDDGVVASAVRGELLMDRYVWELYKFFPDTPIVHSNCYRAIIGQGFFNGDTNRESVEATLRHIVKYQGLRSFYEKRDLNDTVVRISEMLFNEVYLKSEEYNSTIDALDAVEMIEDPVLLDILENMDESPDGVDRANRTYIEKIKTGYSNMVLHRTSRCGALSDSQLVQLAVKRGYATDLDRTVFPYMVDRGFLTGLETPYNVLVESTTAAKALNAAGASIQKSEYASRRFQQLCMFVTTCINVDCGSTKYTPMYVTEKYLANSEGIYYVLNKDDGNDKLLCFDTTEKDLIGKVVYTRTAWNCTLDNPAHVCVHCAGEVFNNYDLQTNLGYLVAAYVMEKVTQRILSFKHVVKSISSSILRLEGKAKQFFVPTDSNELILRDNVSLDGLFVVISHRELDKLTDALAGDVSEANVHKLGVVKKVGLYTADGKFKHEVNVSTPDREAIITHEFLEHIAESDFSVDSRGYYNIPLDGWDPDMPMFEVPIKEADVALYVSEVEKLVEGGSDKKDTLDQHYFKLVDKILENSKCNMAVLGIMNYAISTYNAKQGNYSLARMSPVSGFAPKEEVFRNRSLGPFMVSGSQSRTILSNPEDIFSLHARQDSPLDNLLCPNEVVLNYHKKK